MDEHDHEIVAKIGELAEEERQLEEAHKGDGLAEHEKARLRQLEVTLDRLWDLLRQRRALRQSGRDPEGASERSEGTVEGYLQ